MPAPDLPPSALYAWVAAFVDELARSGLRHVCICPGSRSTPLATVIALDARLKVWMHLDERSAAFFALGLAKASREPVAALCTSGTAAANFMPAVVEANLAHVPLLVLTADRPPELREVGAPQTIDQIRLYGSHVKWSVEMPTPSATDELLRYARVTACRALALTRSAPRGPVHLNFPFREPLAPVDAPEEIAPGVSPVALHGRANGAPYIEVTAPAKGVNVPPEVAALVNGIAEGLIVCGPLDHPDLAPPLTRLAARLGYPILADPLSGLRAGAPDQAPIVDAYDAFLRDERTAARLAPRLVIRFGAMPTSKPVLQYLQHHADCPQIVVAEGDWPEPTLLASRMIHADPAAWCEALLAALPAAQAGTERHWPHEWLRINNRARLAMCAGMAAMDELFEGRVFAELADLLPAGSTLWVGSSMPVRDLDTFFPTVKQPLRMLANRGANGIDGVVSSALGAAAGGSGPTLLVIGDISFYHDMNGLLAARHDLDLTIVLINNDGGGIFSFLPQAANPVLAAANGDSSPFETLFGTPHGLDFRHAAALHGAAYCLAAGWDDFRRAVRAGLASGGLHVVEVRTNRARNVALHRQLWPAVARAVAE